jgi:hypothetical protein
VKEITFLGNKLSSEDVQPDHAKVKVVREMAYPTHGKGIPRVWGMAKTENLRTLHQDRDLVEWNLTGLLR